VIALREALIGTITLKELWDIFFFFFPFIVLN
jgi:hypothetical protein